MEAGHFAYALLKDGRDYRAQSATDDVFYESGATDAMENEQEKNR